MRTTGTLRGALVVGYPSNVGQWALGEVDEILRGEDGLVRGFVQRDDRGRDAWAKDVPLTELAVLLRLRRTSSTSRASAAWRSWSDPATPRVSPTSGYVTPTSHA